MRRWEDGFKMRIGSRKIRESEVGR